MRRIAIVALGLCAGCEDYAYGPEIIAWAPDEVLELDTEEELVLETWLDFVDDDGDVTVARLLHHKPNGTSVRYDDCRPPRGSLTLPCTALLTLDPSARDFDRITAGTIELAFKPSTPWYGQHVVEVWLVDREGFESNHAVTVFELFAPEREP